MTTRRRTRTENDDHCRHARALRNDRLRARSPGNMAYTLGYVDPNSPWPEDWASLEAWREGRAQRAADDRDGVSAQVLEQWARKHRPDRETTGPHSTTTT